MTEPSNLTDDHPSDAEDEISLLDLLVVLAKHKMVILGLPFVVAVIVSVRSLQAPDIYTAATTLLPPQQSQSAAASIAAQLGGLASLVGGSVGLRGTNDLYIAMLKSRTVADRMIQRFGLRELWKIETKHPSDAYEVLESITKISSEKDGTMTIAVDDKDPQRAADLANAYVDELLKLTQVLAVTEASQRRLFFERQFAQAKDNLAKAEAAARQALEHGGLVKVDEQGRAMVENTARLRGQITVKEVQIGAMRAFATDRNPELQRAQQELESLKRELARMEGAGGTKAATNVPSSEGADSLRLLRDVKYYEVIFDLLARQYEAAKIDEAKDSAVIQVLDKAVPPDRKSKPFRSRIVLLNTLGALFAAILWAFLREAMARTRNNPEQAQRLQVLRRYLAWRRVD